MVPIEKHFKFEKEVARPKSKVDPILAPGEKKPIKASKLIELKNEFNRIMKKNRERSIIESAPADPSRFYRDRQEALAKEVEEDN